MKIIINLIIIQLLIFPLLLSAKHHKKHLPTKQGNSAITKKTKSGPIKESNTKFKCPNRNTRALILRTQKNKELDGAYAFLVATYRFDKAKFTNNKVVCTYKRYIFDKFFKGPDQGAKIDPDEKSDYSLENKWEIKSIRFRSCEQNADNEKEFICIR